MPTSKPSHLETLADDMLAQEEGWDVTPERRAAVAEASFARIDRALLIPIERISPMRDNPRQRFDHLDELADSIADRGLIQPLIVRRDPDPQKPGYYMTIAGARRLMAANILRGHEEPDIRASVAVLPCIVADEANDSALASALAENLARDDLTRTEAMDAMLRLEREYGWSARQIAKRTGRNDHDVSELLRVAKDEDLSTLVREEIIAPSTAGMLSTLPAHVKSEAIGEVRAGKLRTISHAKQFKAQRQPGRRAGTGLNNGQVREFTHLTINGAAATVGEETGGVEQGDLGIGGVDLGTASARPPATDPRALAENHAEEVRQARVHAEALRALVEPHPLLGWEAEVRPALDAVYESREKLSGRVKADAVATVEDVRVLIARICDLLEQADHLTEGVRADPEVQAIARRCQAILTRLVIP